MAKSGSSWEDVGKLGSSWEDMGKLGSWDDVWVN